MSTITVLDADDLKAVSRTDINNNFAALNADKIETSVLDTDTALTANSDAKVATQKAVKAYVDAGGNVNASETTKGIVEEATQTEVNEGAAVGTTGAELFVNPSKLLGMTPKTTTFTSSGTYTLPSVPRLLFVECYGGGGGGAVANSSGNGTAAATGGGGGEYKSAFYFSNMLSANVTVTIGAGGAARTTTGREALAGNAGSATTFGSYLSANGGAGGNAQIQATSGTSSVSVAAGGTGGATTFASVAVEAGGDGGSSIANGTSCAHTENAGESTTLSGAGGGSANANQTCASAFSSAGGAATNSQAGDGGAGSNTIATAGGAGGGGGGGAASYTANVTSGAGGDGLVRVTEYL